MVKPTEVVKVFSEVYPEDEKRTFWTKYKAIQQVQELPFEEQTTVKPISPPDYLFKIRFRSGEKEHEFTVYDWEVDALYFNLKKRGDSPAQANEKVITKLWDDVCGADKDLYFFLGNIASHPQSFTIVGLWYPGRSKGSTRRPKTTTRRLKATTPSLFDGM